MSSTFENIAGEALGELQLALMRIDDLEIEASEAYYLIKHNYTKLCEEYDDLSCTLR